ncbi:MAG TPA: hypothetical protein VF112_01260 [Candidatus Dormibacteraeota bacterium]
MTVRLRLAAFVGVAAAGIGCAGAGLATTVLAHTARPSGVVAVDVNPTASGDDTDISAIAYAFPAGTGDVATAAPTTAMASPRAAATSIAPLGLPASSSVVNAPLAAALPFQTPVPGCTAQNNNCGLPTCAAGNSACSLLNCVATAACNPANPTGLGTCQPSAAGGQLGCGLGGSGLNDCFIGLGCGLGGFGLGGCGLFSFSGCGLNLLGPGCTFSGSCRGIGCGFFGGCGGHNDCLGFGFLGFGGGDDEDSSHHGCGSFSDFGFGNFHFHGFRDFHFSSSHSGHSSKGH